ncbi:toll/interleukin-1 receptor domain-containing protein [Rhizobium rhizogenes]|uniref:toll/interleukin-1 receptor domain-containing protein n=1 Tax=Rhizobium rhizogenes TaxID=359 RepID=UPI003ECF6B8D
MRFFISYTRADKGWAEWIGHEVEEAGHSATLQAWDFLPGMNFVLQMQEAASSTDRTIVVLSPDYLTSQFGAAEWAAAFRTDPEGLKQKLLPIMVRPCEPTGLLSSIVYVEVHDLSEEQAREAVRNALAGRRGKPSGRPSFPGAALRQHDGHGRSTLGGLSSSSKPVVPKLKVRATDLDRKQFLRDGFRTIQKRFESHARQIHSEQPRIKVDVELTATTDMRAEIFVDAKSVSACRVWIGVMVERTAIGYAEGQNFSENSYNEMLSIEEDDELYFRATLAIGFQKVSVDPKRMSAEQAGQYLWERFAARVGSH